MSFTAGFENLQQDKEFEGLYRNIQRRNTHPPKMARDSKINAGGKARRQSSVVSNSTATSSIRSRFSAAGGPVQALPAARASPSSEAGWSNITGFRKQLDVDGSPESDYFKSGASKFDRRAEYIGRPLTESCFHTNNTPRYRSQPDEYPNDPDDEDEYDDDGSSTVLPSESVSQVGRGRSRAKPTGGGLFGEVRQGQQQPPPRPPNPAPPQRSRTYSNAVGGSLFGAQQGSSAGRRYSVEERKPRVS